MEYKVNQKVWHIEINNAQEEKSYRKNGVNIEELKIIGISDYKICVNNDWFSSFDIKKKRKESYYHYLDDVSVSIRTGDSILGDGVFVSLFSTKKPSKNLLEKMVAKASLEIDKKYGFLFKGAKDELYNFVNNYKY